jgi:hypothetical protein
LLSTWRHSGFNIFCGNRIFPDDDTAMENLARYIIRASFSQERMQYLDQEGTVVYTSKDGATTRNFLALEWLAAMCSHIPNRGEQMVRYYGDPSVIRSILEHLGLWLARARPPPKAYAHWGHDAALYPHQCAAHDPQLQTHADTIFGDPEYSWDAYIQA